MALVSESKVRPEERQVVVPVGHTIECDRNSYAVTELGQCHTSRSRKHAAHVKASVTKLVCEIAKVHARRTGGDRLARMVEQPLMVALSAIVAIADVSLWLHAQNIVVAAAQEGAKVASRDGGSAVAGQQAATDFLRAGLGPCRRASSRRAAGRLITRCTTAAGSRDVGTAPRFGGVLHDEPTPWRASTGGIGPNLQVSTQAGQLHHDAPSGV
jgi:hypothetical protein